MRHRLIWLAGLCAAWAGAARCGGSDTGPASPSSGVEEEEERTFLPEGSRCEQVVPPEVLRAGSADPNCTPRVESIEADLNHDGHMDLRRVYLLGCPTMLGEEVQPEIMCREADLNYDGRKDIFRHFRAGEVASEEQDWDFDGVIDAVLHFAGGNPLSVEFDRNRDGRFEMQVLLQEGNVRRVKVDAVGDEHYDIYETYEIQTDTGEPRLISIGYDLQGDGSMDRLVSATGPEQGTEAAPPATPAPGEE